MVKQYSFTDDGLRFSTGNKFKDWLIDFVLTIIVAGILFVVFPLLAILYFGLQLQ